MMGSPSPPIMVCVVVVVVTEVSFGSWPGKTGKGSAPASRGVVVREDAIAVQIHPTARKITQTVHQTWLRIEGQVGAVDMG